MKSLNLIITTLGLAVSMSAWAAGNAPSITVTYDKPYTVNHMVLNARIISSQDVSKLNSASVQTIQKVCGTSNSSNIQLQASTAGAGTTVSCITSSGQTKTLDPQTASVVMSSGGDCGGGPLCD